MANTDSTNQYQCGPGGIQGMDSKEPQELRQQIEPWLSSLLQSENLALLVGSGLAAGLVNKAGKSPTGMQPLDYSGTYQDKMITGMEASAKSSGRVGADDEGEPNIENQLRVALELSRGLELLQDDHKGEIDGLINNILKSLINGITEDERNILSSKNAVALLRSFIVTFASRATSRERLEIFTTNYDRLIEYGCDETGINVLDRFAGALNPVFRSSRLKVDMHYNPPGIRGEPRYLEGVVRLTKLHGSLDWHFEEGQVRKRPVPFGTIEKTIDEVDLSRTRMIYPNAAKDIETTEYPYAELFRDFASAICRPQSTLVTYGYGFGDEHISRVISNMLTIPSTHLVVISYGDPGKRVSQFLAKHNPGQFSFLMGNHFGDIENLVKYYLPKPALDDISHRYASTLENRRITNAAGGAEE